MNTKINLIISAICLITLGTGIGWWLAKSENPSSQMTTNAAPPPPKPEEPKVLYWYDPMQPQQHFDHPGKSPFMDMQLVAKYTEPVKETNPDPVAGITIDSAITQNLGVRLATVSRISVGRQIEASGLIALNDRDVAIIQTRSAGFVERVWPLAVGDIVKASQPLAEILVPEWVAVQQEYLALRDIAEPTLQTAARERLRLAGIPPGLIKQLERTGVVQSHITITASKAGVIQELEVREGMTVMTGQTLARINGLSSVWLEIAVPQAQADAIKIGNKAQVRLSTVSGQTIDGQIAAILPVLNENSRSIRVRIELKNPQGMLRPGISAQVTLNNETKESSLAVPTEALIRTGKRTLVMLASEQGRFTPKEVSTGHEIGDQTLILAGLEEGQRVVSSGQFLIDSEASLNGVEAESIKQSAEHLMAPTPVQEHATEVTP